MGLEQGGRGTFLWRCAQGQSRYAVLVQFLMHFCCLVTLYAYEITMILYEFLKVASLGLGIQLLREHSPCSHCTSMTPHAFIENYQSCYLTNIIS